MIRALRTVKDIIRDNRLLAGVYTGRMALAGPRQVHVDLTNKCNLRCLCCWHRSPLLREEERIKGWGAWELSYETVLRLIDDLAALGVERVVYSGGGDPLLHPRLFEIVRHTVKRGIEARLITNLTCAEEETVEEIVAAGVRELSVSLWAARPETYAALHPGCTGETFEKVLGLIRLFTRLRGEGRDGKLSVMNVLTPHNYGELGEMVRLAIGLGASEVFFQLVDVQTESLSGFLFSREQLDGMEELIQPVEAELRSPGSSSQRIVIDFDLLLRRIRDPGASRGWYQSQFIDSIPCYAGWSGGRVLANGEVVPCCKGERFSLGNVNRTSFREIWRSKEYAEFRERALTTSKFNPYFMKILCGRMCDDWGNNQLINHQYRQFLKHLETLRPLERLLVNLRLRRRATTAITAHRPSRRGR